MVLELVCFNLVALFVALAALGHALLFTAAYKCWRDDWADSRRIKTNLPSAAGEEDPLPSGAGSVVAAARPQHI